MSAVLPRAGRSLRSPRATRLRAAGRIAGRRALAAGPVLVVVSAVVFALGAASPFDPVHQYLGVQAFTATDADLAATRAALDLDAPVWQQWWDWARGLVTGDWGTSRSYRQPVGDVVAQRLPWTALLAATGLALAVGAALVLGTAAAWRQNGVVDRLATGAAHALEAVPGFLLGLGALTLLALQVRLLPAGGLTDPGAALSVGQVARHLVLPASVLAVTQMPWLVLTLRQQLLVALADDAAAGARARGLPERSVVLRHALPAAGLPFLTTLGTRLPELVTGVVVVEAVFSWPGLAEAVVTAGLALDFPLLAAVTLLSTALVLGGNLLADTAAALLDPRGATDG